MNVPLIEELINKTIETIHADRFMTSVAISYLERIRTLIREAENSELIEKQIVDHEVRISNLEKRKK